MNPRASTTPPEYRCRPGRPGSRFGYSVQAERRVHLGVPQPRVLLRVWVTDRQSGAQLAADCVIQHSPQRRMTLREVVARALWRLRREAYAQARIRGWR